MESKVKPDLNATDESRRDFLWRVISRIDLYIGSTNTKAAFVLTFCTVAFGLVATSPEKLLLPFERYSLLYQGVALAIFAVVGSLLAALWFALKVISPFLKTTSEPGGFHSRVFFKDIAAIPTADKFHASIGSVSIKDMEEDLAKQAHALAEGATAKFENLKASIGFLLFVTFPIFVVYLVLRLFVTICGG